MTDSRRKKPNYVNFWLQLKDIHVDILERSLQELEYGVEQRWAQYGEEFNTVTSDYTEDEIADYVDHVYDDIALMRDELPRIAKQSMFQTVFGFYEHQLLLLCRAFSANDSGGSVPARGTVPSYKEFLISNNCIHPDKFNEHWENLFQLIEVRNTFVHYAGYIGDVDNSRGRADDIKRIVNGNPGLFELERDLILVKDEANAKVVQLVRQALGELV